MKINRHWLLITAIELFFTALIGCGPSTPKSSLPTTQMKIGKKNFTLEIAATQDSREFGLMRRDSMPADHGMIFVFQSPQTLPFWMKNTRIPLDIIYVDEHGKVDSVKQMQPYVETPVSSEGQVKWAIELNQGAAADAGIKAGDVVEIPEPARNTKE